MLINYKRKAKHFSYRCMGNGKPYIRKYEDVKYIVIHYTSGKNDTAKNECDYFASGNTRSAGCHFFVDENGLCGRSVPMKYVAYHCGGSKYANTKGGTYYKKCTNTNSVGIELCGIADNDCTKKQIAKVKSLVKYIKKHCPNAKTIIRHYDVTGKICPSRYIDTKKWNTLKNQIGG